MSTTPLKYPLFLIIIAALVLPAVSFAQTTEVNPRSVLDKGAVDIGTLAGNETFRYGRELYRKGDYPEAAKVFLRILKVDCANRLAQYHLQKISQAKPEFAYLKEYLRELPCQQYDFNEEVFLPASFYFEKDPDLMLEQLETYNKRYRNNKTTLAVKLAEYATAAKRLEERLREMSEKLNQTKETDAKTIDELISQMTLAKAETESINDQLSELKKALAQAAAARKAELDAQAKKIKPTRTKKAQPAKVKAVQPSSAATADSELASLQEKFEAIQKRLQEIEISVTEKNKHLQSLQEGLGTINK